MISIGASSQVLTAASEESGEVEAEQMVVNKDAFTRTKCTQFTFRCSLSSAFGVSNHLAKMVPIESRVATTANSLTESSGFALL